MTWLGVVMAVLVVVVLAVCKAYGAGQRPVREVPEPAQRLLPGPGPGAAPVPPIPRIIWSYWHGGAVPGLVQRCVDNWCRLNPGWKVHLLGAADLAAHVPPTLSRLGVPKQSDWIRLALLARHGGVWLDASIFLTRPLDWVLEQQQAWQTEFAGYYLDRYASGAPGACPVVDSWFMAAPPGSRFVVDWLALFEREAVVGDTADYLAGLRASGRYEAFAQKIGDPAYHTIHLCAQQILQQAPGDYRLLLLRAEDGPYALHVPSRWKRRRLYVRLLLHPQPSPAPALIKLRGGERRKLEPYLRRGLYRRDSLAGRYLMARGQASAPSSNCSTQFTNS